MPKYLKHDDEGWHWLDPHGSGQWFGGYESRKEAEEARESFKRNWIELFNPSEICTGST